MPRTPTRGLLASAAIVASLTLPSTAAAQYRLPTITSVAKADSLHESALVLSRDSKRWREIADLNNIRNPRELKIGQRLRMPK